MGINKISMFIMALIAIAILSILASFYMKVSCSGMYEPYMDLSKPVDPVVSEADLPNRYKNILCMRISPQEFWIKLTITAELKQKLINEFKAQKEDRNDDLTSADNASKNTGVTGVNIYTLVNWAALKNN
jgi:hypothetical protein